jgi:hypothetical protein
MEQKNEYEQAIEAVGNIINAYDTDKEYPVYGFGADVKDSNGVYRKSDYFSLLPDESVLAKGIEGILQVGLLDLSSVYVVPKLYLHHA